MRTFALLVASTLFALPLAGQAPDFSGRWKLNAERSDAPPARGGGLAAASLGATAWA